MWSNWNSPMLPVGIKNGTAILKNSFAVAFKVRLPYNTAIPPSSIIPREMKTCSRKNVYTNVYSSSIHNHKKLQTSPELTKYDISIPRNTINNKKQIIHSHNLDESQRHSAE